VCGGLLLGLSGLAYYAKDQKTRLIQTIDTAPVLSVAQVSEQLDRQAEIPVVQLKAKTYVPPAQELKADVTKQLTSAFRIQVDEIAEVRYGNSWHSERTVLNSHEQGQSLFLKDGSSDQCIEAPLRLLQDHYRLFLTSNERFELKEQTNPALSLFGQMAFRIGNVDMALGASTNDKRVLGYRFRESLIPVGRPVYALGSVSAVEIGGAGGERVLILKPAAGHSSAIATFDTQEQIKAKAENEEYWWKLASLISGSVGSALLLSSAAALSSSPKR